MSGFTAFTVLLVSGIFNGSTTVPVKYAKHSAWENLWLVQSVFGMLLLPWLLVLTTVPHPVQVYHDSGLGPLLATGLFGLGWGLGSVFFIWGIVLVGMSLGFAVVLSLTATLGSLLPLLILTPGDIHTRRGHLLLWALTVTVLGIALCADAGRGSTANAESPKDVTKAKAVFWRGLFICILSGVFSPMLNFSFAFGSGIAVTAQHLGTNVLWSNNALWAPTFSAAFVVNSLYCVWHIGGVRTSHAFFWKAPIENLVGGFIMGFLLIASIVLYGMSAQALGPFGTTAGWAINMCATILAANLWGMLTGEWHDLSRRAILQQIAGLGCMASAIVLASPQS